jgi:Rrf2 family protein
MMRISTKGRYSLEALLYLALRQEAGGGVSDKGGGVTTGAAQSYVSTREIAEASGYSEGYLEQLFIPLRKAGLIRGVRGPQGGYHLGRPPQEIKAGDILRAVEGSLKPADCVEDKQCPKSKKCESRQTWNAIYKCITETIDSITLLDLTKAFGRLSSPDYMI